MPSRNDSSRTPTDVASFLEELGLGQYVQRFADNDIEPDMLTTLDDADLQAIGIASLGHRKKILSALAGLTGHAEEGGAPAPSLEGMTLVPIPAGSFMMGSPSGESDRYDDETQHRVTLTRGFLMSATEVTQAQYEAVMGSNPSEFKGASRPVEMVSWYDAVRFCNALSEREGLTAAYRISGENSAPEVTWNLDADGYRLPTEAEWEYACRAGTTTRFHSGNSDSDLELVGWYSGNSNQQTQDVGTKQPNAWGLYDMHGNVWEWCWDRYGDYGGNATDPAGPGSGSARVLRGGGWSDGAQFCRSAYRYWRHPVIRSSFNGFRVVRSSAR